MTMKRGVIAAALIMMGLAAHAKEEAIQVFNVPPLTENNSADTVGKKNLQERTLVQMDPFSVTVPAGWSFLAAGVSEKMNGSLTATPSDDIEHDPTYVGISERKGTPGPPLVARLQRFKDKKKNWTASIEEINGESWLVGRHTGADSKTGKKMEYWAAFAIEDGHEYWLVAGTPAESAAKTEPAIDAIMKSITLGQKPAGKDAKTIPPPDVIDNRLQAKWNVISFTLGDDAVIWSKDEAKALVGSSVTFSERDFQIGDVKCTGTAKPYADHEAEQTLLTDLGAPCGTAAPKGPVFRVRRKKCDKKTNFPPFLTFQGKDDVVAFGDDVSFCLKRMP